jgi:hypothetical protein
VQYLLDSAAFLKSMRHLFLSIFVVAISTFDQQGSSQDIGSQPTTRGQSGTVCVLPNSPDAPTRISPGGEYNPSTLTISIDSRKPMPWPHKRIVKIEDLDLNDRHLIVLRSEGRRIQSFRFRFSSYKDTNLCVSFDGYQGVQFGDKYDTYWCRCR